MKKEVTSGNWIAVNLDSDSDGFAIKDKVLLERGYSDKIAEHIYNEADAKLMAASKELFEVVSNLITAFIHKEGDTKGNKVRTDIFKHCPEFRGIATKTMIAIDKATAK